MAVLVEEDIKRIEEDRAADPDRLASLEMETKDRSGRCQRL